MANTYYLIDSSKIPDAKNLASTEGLPNQLFQYTLSPDGTKAIVQADWINDAEMGMLGTYLGELQPNGSAPQTAVNEVASWGLQEGF